jgi:hypothetical protein
MYVWYAAPAHMARTDKPEEVNQWFEDTIRGLWPIAMGSLSLRKSPCGSTAGLANRVRATPVTLSMAERGSSGFRSMCRMNSLPIWNVPFGMAGIFRK